MSISTSSTGFGLVLFSIISLITARKHWMSQNLITPSNLRKRSPSVNENGELITPNTPSFLSNTWKRQFSDKVNPGTLNECDLVIINDLPYPIMLCWLSPDGQLQNHYPINDKSIKDGSVVNTHEEYTCTKHCFVCFRIQDKIPNKIDEIENLIFHFTPLKANSKHVIKLDLDPENKSELPLINYSYECIARDPLDEPYDNSKKEYLSCAIAGFHIFYEPGVFESIPELYPTLETDLFQVHSLLPTRACKLLKSSTAFWVNKTITFGTKRNPIVGNTCTFHPAGGKMWLIRNGFTEMKEGCIEIFSAEEYLKSRQSWGPGGVLLHELCHAFHNKHCPDGYNCYDIQMIYHIAMKNGLYDCVPVHGKQGLNGPTKAYACTNCMEFFAELSVAYHWNVDDKFEYNKWFPFNRAQLIDYDPETFFVLDNIWNQYEH